MFRVYALQRDGSAATGHRRINHNLHVYISGRNIHVSTRLLNRSIRRIGELAIVTGRDCTSFASTLRGRAHSILHRHTIGTDITCFVGGRVEVNRRIRAMDRSSTDHVIICLRSGKCVSGRGGVAPGCHRTITGNYITPLPSGLRPVTRNIAQLVGSVFSPGTLSSVITRRGAAAPSGGLGSGFEGVRFRRL